MALNVKIEVFRGLRASLASLPSTGFPGVLAYTTDSNELFVDSGSGTGIGPGNAWVPIANDIAVFNVSNPAALASLASIVSPKVGDIALSISDNKTYILVAYPSTVQTNWVAIASNGATIQGLSSGVAHEWVSFIDQNGVQHLTQPTFADIAGNLSQTQLPGTIGAGSSLTVIDCGTF